MARQWKPFGTGRSHSSSNGISYWFSLRVSTTVDTAFPMEGTFMTARTSMIASGAIPLPPNLDPCKLEFGRLFAPLWLSRVYENGAWRDASVEAMHTI